MNSNGFQVRPASLDPDQVGLIINALRGWRYASRMLAREQDRPPSPYRDLTEWENSVDNAKEAALDALTVTIPWHELSAHLAAAEHAYQERVARERAIYGTDRHGMGAT